jgi:hypothetical protein
MPNVPILSLKNTIPRLVDDDALDAFILAQATNYWPFGKILMSARGSDLAAVLMARGTEWELELDFTWTASVSNGGSTDSVDAHIRGTISVTVATDKQDYTGWVGIDPTDPLDSGAVPATVEEETMAHPDSKLTFSAFVGSFADLKFETTHDADPPVDNSASLTYGVTIDSPISVFGGNYIIPGLAFGVGAGVFGPPPGGMGVIISDGAGYDELIGYPDVSADALVYPQATLCGTVTVIWYHADGGTESLTCNLYTVDMAIMSAGVGFTTSRTVSVTATITQTAGLRYGDTYLPSGERV